MRNEYEEADMLEYNEEQFPQEDFDNATLKEIESLSVDVPSDEEASEQAREIHGDISMIGQAKIDLSFHPAQRHPNAWQNGYSSED